MTFAGISGQREGEVSPNVSYEFNVNKPTNWNEKNTDT
jgi:hypothetical protein